MLIDSVAKIKGIGEETAKALNGMGIHTIIDLMEYFPYRYEDYRLKDLKDVKHQERVTVVGKVQSEATLRYFTKKKSRVAVRVLIDRYLITCVFFNRPYVKKQLQIGETITITGSWDKNKQSINVSEMKKGEMIRSVDFEPVYHVQGDVTVKGMKRFISLALQEFGDFIEDYLPDYFRSKYKLLPRKEAVRHIHFPKSKEHLKHARRRLVYEEFLLFQLKMQALRKFNREQSNGKGLTIDENEVQRFINALPYPLTNAQQRVIKEILTDMMSQYRMNRLLQGDVGSGKTAVAMICSFAAIQAGVQAALMVPTEILAEQHVQSLKETMASFALRVELLTSSIKGKKRKELLEKLASGEIDIIVGTHSLIQDEVSFSNLGLVITDEQHRFGVEQRRVLREKGEHPDVLFMTATPIPRTLAITAFGDMDVSVINEMPAGRKPVETYWAKKEMLERVLAFLYKEIKKGSQAYVICPLIEESEKLDVQNAIDVHQMLHHYFKDRAKVGLMHGRLLPAEKDEVMKKFSNHQYDILVSTTVVEVGVNVPNATVMVIYDAERFGLSQLHQLRGRVGRGEEQSYCILLANPKTEIGQERMRIMTETNDGFELSQRDLELRGPGDFFGKKQSGVPEFKVADMVHDYRALETARQDAVELIESPHFWKDDTYRVLRQQLFEIYKGEKLD